MGNPIIDLIRFLYNDFKTDWLFVKEVIQGKKEIKFTPEQIEELKDWRGILKENYLFFIIVISAFCAGYFIAQVHLNNVCIGAVQDWYMSNMQIIGNPELSTDFVNTFNITISP